MYNMYLCMYIRPVDSLMKYNVRAALYYELLMCFLKQLREVDSPTANCFFVFLLDFNNS